MGTLRKKTSVARAAASVGGAALFLAMTPGAQAAGYRIFSTFVSNGIEDDPVAGVVVDVHHTTYGMASSAFYEITKAGAATVLYSFGDATKGYYIDGDLTVDPTCAIKGATCMFYGTTYFGGKHNVGVVYKISRQGGYHVLYKFTGGSDGGHPMGSLVLKAGTIYGMTGKNGHHDGGTVFKIAPDGTETVLKYFSGPNGYNPGYSGLTADAAGNLYGTTLTGDDPFKSGIAFKLSPDGTETILHGFRALTEGRNPNGGLVLDKDGNLYGTTTYGGPGGSGTVFKIGPGGAFRVLYAFTGGSDGGQPTNAHLTLDSAGNVFGTTETGGFARCKCGVVFEISASGQFSVLHRFKGAPDDGSVPVGSLFLDENGTLHGATNLGGAQSNRGGGVIYEIPGASQASAAPADPSANR